MADLPSASPRIALAQFNPCVGDLSGNAQRILDHAERATHNGVELLLTPLGALAGFPLSDLALDPAFRAAHHDSLKDLARKLRERELGALTVVLAPGRELSATHSSVAVIREGAVDFISHPETGSPSIPVVATSAAHRIGISVGGLPQDLTGLSGQDLDLLAILDATPFERDGPEASLQLMMDGAQAAGVAVARVNLVGGQDEYVFEGGSAIIAGSGTLRARSPLFTEDLLISSVGDVEDISPDLPELAQIYRAISLGLADYVAKNGFTSVVLGLSGGIDSALLAAVAADAIGGARVVCVSMPSPHSSEHSKTDAADLARRIGADFRTIPIGDAMESLLAATPLPGVAAENLQARIRGILLMALANVEGHLVLAPGNKSELAVGYSTVYGDAVGGYAPLKDVMKSEVWALARWRNNQAIDAAGLPPIPESSITKPPSAELRPGQVDQDSLPEYDVLDPLLTARFEQRASRDELINQGFEADVVDKILHLIRISEWKRRQYPQGPKVTAMSFDADRKVPITSRWRDQ